MLAPVLVLAPAHDVIATHSFENGLTSQFEPSPVLESMGISDAINRSSIRISIGRFTTQSDMDFFVSHYCDSVDRLRDG